MSYKPGYFAPGVFGFPPGQYWKPSAAQKAAVEKAAADKAATLGLLLPLEALSLDADTLSLATVAAVAYCDAQGAASVADLAERASRLIIHRPCRPISLE